MFDSRHAHIEKETDGKADREKEREKRNENKKQEQNTKRKSMCSTHSDGDSERFEEVLLHLVESRGERVGAPGPRHVDREEWASHPPSETKRRAPSASQIQHDPTPPSFAEKSKRGREERGKKVTEHEEGIPEPRWTLG